MKNIDDNKIVSLLKRRIRDLQAVYLFGSVVGDQFSTHSDLDIAVKAGAMIDPIKRWEIQEELAVLVGRNVDLLDLVQASLVMKFEVINTGQRIFCGDIDYIESYETSIFSQYLDFNEIRGLIIDAILERGNVYGD